jgi:hypothetical protein
MSKGSILFLSRTWKGDILKAMQGHIACPVKPDLTRPCLSKSPAGPAAFPAGGGVVIFIFLSRGNPVKFADPDGRDVKPLAGDHTITGKYGSNPGNMGRRAGSDIQAVRSGTIVFAGKHPDGTTDKKAVNSLGNKTQVVAPQWSEYIQ